MFRSSIAASPLLLAALSLLTVSGAWAQALSKPDPSNTAAAVPSVVYNSSFSPYRAFVEQDVAPWRDTNDTAGRIGGWRVYAREALEPESGGAAAQPRTASPNPAGQSKPMPSGPASHGMH